LSEDSVSALRSFPMRRMRPNFLPPAAMRSSVQ
jgi:hypothetical protein